DKVLEEANKYINNGRFALTVHNFTDGFLGVINKRPKGTYKKIRSKFFDMFNDMYMMPRNAITLGNAVQFKHTLIAKTLDEAEKR
ncbi:hypothetical protein, partial [Francisella philomiragia]